MHEVSSYIHIIAGCSLVILSYIYNFITAKTGIPSVLLLLLTGITVREVLLQKNVVFAVPGRVVELFGILGLIMIVLEAGLDQCICCIRNAGIGVSFCSTNQFADAVADYIIKEPDFGSLIPILN